METLLHWGVQLIGMKALLLKLGQYVKLSNEDRCAIDRLQAAPLVDVAARMTAIHEGDEPKVVRLMVSGWACRYKELPDGRRQILGFFIPGDICDLNVYILRQMDHSIGAVTPITYRAIPPSLLNQLIRDRPRIAQALLWHDLVNASIQREWLLNLGQRTAFERLAHLFVELFVRLQAIGKTQGESCELPLTQNDLADATGVTPVHLNRSLQELRRDGLLEFRAKHLRILDFERLKQVAMFNPNYLHLDHEGRHLDAND